MTPIDGLWYTLLLRPRVVIVFVFNKGTGYSDIQSVGFRVETAVSFLVGGISDKDTLFGTGIKFGSGSFTNMNKYSAPEHSR